MTGRKDSLLIGLLSALMLLVNCVNPFAPALDKSQGSLIITEQRTPEEVLQNFRYAYTFRDSILYSNLLDSSFVFVYFDPSLARDVSWGRDVDLKTTGRLFQAFDVIDLTWDSTRDSAETGDVSELTKRFTLNLVAKDIEFRITGDAVFAFRRDPYDQKWRVTHWRDLSQL